MAVSCLLGPPISAAMPPQTVNPYVAAVAQRNQMAQASETAFRRSRKPTEKNLPDGIEDVVIGEGVQQYKEMRELEKRLDAAVVRKRLDIQDSVSKTVKKFRTMRIWISNTAENQPWQNAANGSVSASETNPGAGRYTLKIEGRLLDDDADATGSDNGEGEGGNPASDAAAGDNDGKEGESVPEGKTTEGKNRSTGPKHRFSHFFKSIAIDFDKPAMSRPEDFKSIVWNKPQLQTGASPSSSSADFDMLEMSRATQENLNVTVSLMRDETPERFKLNKELADLLDVDEEDRSGIVLGIWDYIRAMGLQRHDEKRLIHCDDRMRAVCTHPSGPT